MANINIRTDEEVKEQAEQIVNALGISLSSAINAFLRQVIIHQGIPFDIKLIPNEITLKALEEGDKISEDSKTKRYKNVDELRKALGV